MTDYERYTIQSLKHDRSVHRVWKSNWKVPDAQVDIACLRESMSVLINYLTIVTEASGREWLSDIPAVCFFLPDQWYNVVALLKPSGVQFYCNVASPPEDRNGVLTYIDYDIDIVLQPNGQMDILDLDEYNEHKIKYRYEHTVQRSIEHGFVSLKQHIQARRPPFDDVKKVLDYFDTWTKKHKE